MKILASHRVNQSHLSFYPSAMSEGVHDLKTFFKKIVDLAFKYFNILQWSFLSLYGVKEILFDRVKELSQPSNKISQRDVFINRIYSQNDHVLGPIRYNQAHGSLYLMSGVAGSFSASHRLGWIKLGNFDVPLEIVGNCLFCFASFIALIQNIKLYQAASKVSQYAPAYEKEGAEMIKKSAIIGIISSLSYILAAGLLIMGVQATLALLLGCLAVFTGCIKILYDFIRFKNI